MYRLQYNILMCIFIITICIILFPLILYLRELSSIRVWMSMMKILILKTLMSWNLVWVLKRYEMVLPEENSKYNKFLNTITSLISVLLDPVCRPRDWVLRHYRALLPLIAPLNYSRWEVQSSPKIWSIFSQFLCIALLLLSLKTPGELFITPMFILKLSPCRPYTHHANSAGQNKSNLKEW